MPEAEDTASRTVPLDAIHPNPGQPRKHFDEAAIAELADTIRDMGILQALLVRRVDSGYELISGERRWRAARRAGLDRVPVEVLDVDEVSARLMALVENLQREDLSLIEEAEAYQRLVEEHGLTQEEVAARVGKDRSTVTNALRILKLPPAVKEAVVRGQLSGGHARALLGLPDSQIEAACRQVLQRGLSVRATERLARELKDGRPPSKPSARTDSSSSSSSSSPSVRELEQQLCRALGTRVRLREKRKGHGSIEIAFHSYDELERLLDVLLK
jgi:ParB family chromosome partitioning protein